MKAIRVRVGGKTHEALPDDLVGEPLDEQGRSGRLGQQMTQTSRSLDWSWSMWMTSW